MIWFLPTSWHYVILLSPSLLHFDILFLKHTKIVSISKPLYLLFPVRLLKQPAPFINQVSFLTPPPTPPPIISQQSYWLCLQSIFHILPLLSILTIIDLVHNDLIGHPVTTLARCNGYIPGLIDYQSTPTNFLVPLELCGVMSLVIVSENVKWHVSWLDLSSTFLSINRQPQDLDSLFTTSREQYRSCQIGSFIGTILNFVCFQCIPEMLICCFFHFCSVQNIFNVFLRLPFWLID